MIQELKIKNFLSFKDEVCFSFEATKDTKWEDYQVVQVAENMRLLRFAVVYGANASGKSNLLNAFELLHNFWSLKQDDVKDKTGVIPFKLDKITPNEPSYFDLKFYVGNIKYWYQLELDEQKVNLEKLSVYHSVQPTILFERKLENNISIIEFNPKAIKINNAAKDAITVKCLRNMSFFAAYNQVNVTVAEIDTVINWINNNVMPSVELDTNLFNYAERQMIDNENLKSYLLNFIKEADFNISNIHTQIVKQEIPQNFLDFILKDDDIPSQERERLNKEKTIEQIRTEFEHTVLNANGEEKYLLPTRLQSEGTRRIFGIEAAIYDQLQKQAFLAIDEIESSLHPELVELVLVNFLIKKNNRSQLLITTHNDSLLNTIDDVFRKDSVWFAEKQKDGHTLIYSLVEFKGLNRLSSIQKAYRFGNFGAIPQINI